MEEIEEKDILNQNDEEISFEYCDGIMSLFLSCIMQEVLSVLLSVLTAFCNKNRYLY